MAACTTTVEEDPDAPVPCLAPNREVGELCLAPGTQDDGCAAGSWAQADGTCWPAGVAEALCPEGWVHDGDTACEPSVPAAPCPAGEMALPHEAACRPVASCGSGKWGDIPIEPGNTTYVDANYGGSDSDGSEVRPWSSIADAVVTAPSGGMIAVAAGSYAEDIVLVGKPLRIWGVCPGQVELRGTSSPDFAPLVVREGADGSEVHGMAVTTTAPSALSAILISGATNVLFDRLWIHDAAARGINVQSDFGPTGLTLRGSLVENNRGLGVLVAGADIAIEGVLVRGTAPQGSGALGRGISIEPSSQDGSASTFALRDVLIESNHEMGLLLAASEGTAERIVVRDTLPQASDQKLGRGIGIQTNPADGKGAKVTIRGALVERNFDTGIFVEGSEATLEGIVVRDTFPRALDQERGRGLNIQAVPETGAGSVAEVRGMLIERSRDAGVFVDASVVNMAGIVVRDTTASEATQFYGRGIGIQSHMLTGAPSTLLLRGSIVERSQDTGVFVAGSEATLVGVVIREIAAEPASGRYGDAIGGLALAPPGSAATRLVVQDSVVASSHRAGVALFGATAELRGVLIGCVAFPIAVQSFEGVDFDLLDQGRNQCGCPPEEAEPDASCRVVGSELEPPRRQDVGAT